MPASTREGGARTRRLRYPDPPLPWGPPRGSPTPGPCRPRRLPERGPTSRAVGPAPRITRLERLLRAAPRSRRPRTGGAPAIAFDDRLRAPRPRPRDLGTVSFAWVGRVCRQTSEPLGAFLFLTREPHRKRGRARPRRSRPRGGAAARDPVCRTGSPSERCAFALRENRPPGGRRLGRRREPPSRCRQKLPGLRRRRRDCRLDSETRNRGR